MAEITADLAATLDPYVQRQAKVVADRYEGVEAEDLAQEVWVWIVEEGSPAFFEYARTGEKSALNRSLYNVAVKWCEAEKRRRMKEAGIDWRDEYNYTRPEVARLLPAALDTQSVPGMSGREVSDAPVSKGDPAEGGDLLVSLIDVRTAYSKLSESDQRFIQVVVGLNTEWDQIAATTSVKATSAYAKYMRILDRMVTRHLGRKTDESEVGD